MSEVVSAGKLQLLYLEWDDSMSYDRWVDVDEVVHTHGVLGCVSVGWLIKEDRHAVTIAPHFSHSGKKRGPLGKVRQVSGDMSIPKSAITRRRVIRNARKG